METNQIALAEQVERLMTVDIVAESVQRLESLTRYNAITHEAFKVITESPRFLFWSGAGKPEHHHYGYHGLLLHTTEVLEYASASVEIWDNSVSMRKGIVNFEFDPEVLILSVLFHDVGKLWDYELVSPHYDNGTALGGTGGLWRKTTHAREIGHLTRSALVFQQTFPAYEKMDQVLHCVLSHHGRRDQGSPVAPRSREAWILHLADCQSARFTDCTKHDILDH